MKTPQAIIEQVLNVMQISKVIENVLEIREFSAYPGTGVQKWFFGRHAFESNYTLGILWWTQSGDQL